MADKSSVFTGNIFILHNFDIGDDIDLEGIKKANILKRKPFALSKYFKNYHIPLAVELPEPEESPQLVSAKIHNFGGLILRYQIPFASTLEELKIHLNEIDNEYSSKSLVDAKTIYQKIKKFIVQSKFFHIRNSYVFIQVNTHPENTNLPQFKEKYGHLITSLVHFETEAMSEYQRKELLSDSLSYYKGDLVIIDTEAAFAYDDNYEDKLDLFEFATMQYLELQYFDKLLEQRLSIIYEGKIKVPLKSYLPFTSKLGLPSVRDLVQLRADISVIINRLENSVKLSGDVYYSEVYALLISKLDLRSWRESVQSKLSIIRDVSKSYYEQVNTNRQDFLTIIIIILIFIEMIVALLK